MQILGKVKDRFFTEICQITRINNNTEEVGWLDEFSVL